MHHTQVVTGCAHAQMRSQEVHLLQVLERGRLVRVQRLGRHCWDDDALVLAVQAEAERRWQLLQVPAPVILHFLAREGKFCLFGTLRYSMADGTLLHADDTTVLELGYAHLLTPGWLYLRWPCRVQKVACSASALIRLCHGSGGLGAGLHCGARKQRRGTRACAAKL